MYINIPPKKLAIGIMKHNSLIQGYNINSGAKLIISIDFNKIFGVN